MKLDPRFTHDDYFALARAPAWLLVSLVFLLFVIGSSVSPQEDHGYEFAQADQKEADQRDDAHRRQAIKDCLDERGQGAAPKVDGNGVVGPCDPRWGKRS